MYGLKLNHVQKLTANKLIPGNLYTGYNKAILIMPIKCDAKRKINIIIIIKTILIPKIEIAISHVKPFLFLFFFFYLLLHGGGMNKPHLSDSHGLSGALFFVKPN